MFGSTYQQNVTPRGKTQNATGGALMSCCSTLGSPGKRFGPPSTCSKDRRRSDTEQGWRRTFTAAGRWSHGGRTSLCTWQFIEPLCARIVERRSRTCCAEFDLSMPAEVFHSAQHLPHRALQDRQSLACLGVREVVRRTWHPFGNNLGTQCGSIR